MVGKNLTPSQLQNVVDKTIIDFDEDKDGKLSFKEFEKAFTNSEGLADKLTIKDDWWNKAEKNEEEEENNNDEE
jgi:hypothetical protein